MKSMLSKVIFIYVAFHIFAIFSCGNICNCKASFFELTGFEVSNLDKNAIGNSIFDLAMLEDSASIAAKDFTILFSLLHEECAYFEIPDLSAFFINSALACSCDGPQPCDNLTIFSIKSDADFIQENGTIRKAGETLNAIFDVSFPNQEFDLGPLDAFLTFPNQLLTTDTPHTFSLNVDIEPNQTHTFTIEMDLDDGRRLTATTPTIILE